MNENSTDKILVAQTGGWIGDMILLTPALRALKRAYPRSYLTLLIRPLVANLMESCPYLDEVIVDTKGTGIDRVQSLFQLVHRIRRRRFDLAVVLHPTSFRNALIPFLAGVPFRIGSSVGGRGILLSHTCADDTTLHEVDRYLRVLQLININESATGLEFWDTDADRRAVDQILSDCNVLPEDRIIGINLGTTWGTKSWALDRFADAIAGIQDRFEGAVVLTGSSSEVKLGEALQKLVKANVINLIGKTTILQLGALIERCDLYLTCDSGPMHIAAAVGTPTIALFGPTNPLRHRPYGDGHHVIEKDVSCRPCYKRKCMRKDAPNLCMTEVQATDVVERIALTLNLVDTT
ncbi:MAG: lipopolysaccharide heptosyltransferase II [Candidatus Poribacteria bacterium]|nr:lipopolysaccharide heptosyltransferase II [Candidatus Poribacteria bacterium]